MKSNKSGSMKSNAKLHVVVCADLPVADQVVQAIHAARQFAADHPETERAWFEMSNHLALLAVPNESALITLIQRAASTNVRFAIFREPDLDNRITAAAFEPEAKALCRRLPLALRGDDGSRTRTATV